MVDRAACCLLWTRTTCANINPCRGLLQVARATCWQWSQRDASSCVQRRSLSWKRNGCDVIRVSLTIRCFAPIAKFGKVNKLLTGVNCRCSLRPIVGSRTLLSAKPVDQVENSSLPYSATCRSQASCGAFTARAATQRDSRSNSSLETFSMSSSVDNVASDLW